jgi:hypothetical protein
MLINKGPAPRAAEPRRKQPPEKSSGEAHVAHEWQKEGSPR